MKMKSCLLFALHVLLLSYTLAVDTSKQETTNKKTKEAAEPKEVQAKGDEGKYGVNYGGGGGGGNYGGGGGGSGWGGGCHHGCCYRGHGGSCNRCCSSPEEAKAFAEKSEGKETPDSSKVEPKGEGGKYGVNYGGGGGGGNYGGGGGNYGGGGGGSGWGGRCRHGCCYRGHGGSCNRCCASPEEAKAHTENQSEGKESADTNKVEAKGDGVKYDVNYGGGGGGGNYGGGGGNYGGGGGGSGWGGGCRHGCCYRGHGGSCNRCCASPEEAKALAAKQPEAKGATDAQKVEATGDGGKYGVNYGGGGGNYGGGGGGGGGNYGGGGGNYGGGCRHGCCYDGHGGSCNRCCFSPEEAKAFAESQSRP